MAQLTEEAREILARIYSKEDVTDVVASKILEQPKFIERKTGLTFISDIEDNLGITGAAIIDIQTYKDFKVVFCNYDNGGSDSFGVIGIFRVIDDSFLYAFIEAEELTGNEILKPFKYVNISETGAIVGLQNYGDKVHFFRFTDFLTDLQDFIDGIDTIFFDVNFDISTVIKTDDDGGALEEKEWLGNARFLDYEKIGFNQDRLNQDIFAFVLWSSADDKMIIVRFATDASEINSIRDIQFSFNGGLSLSQGADLPAADFKSISTMGILTGETSDGKTSTFGSIVYSTEKDGGSNVIVKFGPVKINDASDHIVRGGGSRTDRFRDDKTVLINNDGMQAILQPVRDYLANNNLIINPETEIELDLGGGQFTSRVKIDSLLLSANKVELGRRTNVDAKRNNTSPNLTGLTVTQETVIYLDDIPLLHFGTTTTNYTGPVKEGTRNGGKGDATEVTTIGTIFWLTGTSYFSGDDRAYEYSYSVIEDVKLTNYVDGEILENTTKANVTNQIIISRDKDGNDVFNIFASENDSYKGTDPVFLSPLKAYVPLKKRDTRTYSIFEFNGALGENTTAQQKFLNTTAIVDGQLLVELLTPISIDDVFVNEIKIAASRYSLHGNELTITGLAKDETIRVAYQSKVSTPKQINANTSTTSDDFFIAGVSSIDELETNVPSIIGAGDTSNEPGGFAKQVFGMNLYKSTSSDFDEIAEDSQLMDFKVAYVRGYRQKDLLWIEAYNSDFSEYVKWVQIYAESDKPYSKTPYKNTLLELEMERLNSNIQKQYNLSAFDRALLNISTSNNITIATTVAETTDLIGTNDTLVVFGKTNKAIIEEVRTISKTRNITTDININITTTFIDRSGDSDIVRVEPSNEMAKLFNPNETENRDENHINNFKLYDSNGNLIKEDTAYPYISRVGSSVFFNADFVKTDGNSPDLGKIEIYNGVGQLLSTEELPSDCAGLVSYEKEFRFTDEINETEYFTWDVTPWDTKPWQPVATAKGGK